MKENERATADTKCGKVRGVCAKGLYIFRGIPYAAPPTHDRRWLPPQPALPWQGVRKAQAFERSCPQNWSPLNDFIPDFGRVQLRNEDCLYLNVWSPGLDDSRRPVLVWIHGGAFNLGAGSDIPYDAAMLATRGDAVVVTFNYRLGVFGFLRLDEATKGMIPSTGNEGLLDQIAALEWVQDNIAAFGGDPDNVTVFGESAGGMSIECLLTMAPARGLFHKAIIQSPLGEIPGTPLAMAVKVSEQLLGVLGLNPHDAGTIQALTVEQLLFADLELRTKMTDLAGGPVATITTPVLDGESIPEIPVAAIDGGCASGVPVLIGCTRDEFRLFGMMSPDFLRMTETEMVQSCRKIWSDEHASDLIEAYRGSRAGRGADISPAGILAAIQTDFLFRIPVIHFIEAQQRHAPTYNYLFTWRSPVRGGVLGACHALDIGFVFGTYNDSFWGSGPTAERLSTDMQDAWLAFARTGNPSCEALGKWPEYGDDRVTMLLGEECHLEAAAYEEDRRAWELLPRVSGR